MHNIIIFKWKTKDTFTKYIHVLVVSTIIDLFYINKTYSTSKLLFIILEYLKMHNKFKCIDWKKSELTSIENLSY